MRKIHHWPLLFLTLLLVISTGCNGGASQGPPTFVPPPTSVPLSGSRYTVSRTDLSDVVQARGRVAANRETPLLFPVSGILRAVHVQDGDEVSEGTLLAELEAPEIERRVLERRYELINAELALSNTIQSADFELSRAQTSVALAQAQYDRAVLQGEMGVVQVRRDAEAGNCGSWCSTSLEHAESQGEIGVRIAQANLQQARISYNQTAEARDLEIAVAEERVNLARELHLQAAQQLSATLLTAPFSGMVMNTDLQLGAQVQAYDVVGTVADLSGLRVIAQVPTEQLGEVASGESVFIQLDARPGQEFAGSVTQIGGYPLTWQGQNVYEVLISFDRGQDIPMVLGMGADVILARSVRENVLVVPNRAVLTVAGRAYVEVITDNNDIDQVEVELGITDGSVTEIVAGLQEGQIVRIP